MSSYYGTEEYRKWMGQLKGEYAAAYKKIVLYIQTYNLYGTEVSENCLQQILDEFLTGQHMGKPLDKITGNSLRRYCNKIMKAEADRLSLTLLMWLQCIPVFILLSSIFTTGFYIIKKLSIPFRINEYAVINGQVFLFVFLTIFYIIIKRLLAICFFHYPKVVKSITLLAYIATIGLGISILKEEIKGISNLLFIRIPAPLFWIVTILSIVASILLGKSMDRKKSKLNVVVTKEVEDQIEKRTCPNCHKNHDYDYPTCPYCEHKYEEFLK